MEQWPGSKLGKEYFKAIYCHSAYEASLVAQLVRIYLQCGRSGFDPWVGKIPWRREQLPTPVLWPGESHGPYIGHVYSKSRGMNRQGSLSTSVASTGNSAVVWCPHVGQFYAEREPKGGCDLCAWPLMLLISSDCQ